MKQENSDDQLPGVAAAIRGGDTEQPMESEPTIETATIQQAVFWKRTYREILTMEEKVLAKISELMATQSETSRREAELSNVPVIAAQVERFRSRLGYWEQRLQALQLDGEQPRPHPHSTPENPEESI